MTEVQGESPVLAEEAAALAAYLRNLRVRNKMSMDEFALHSKLTKVRLTAVEQGLDVPTRAVLHAYFQLLNPSSAERSRIRELWEAVRHGGAGVLSTALDMVDTRARQSPATVYLDTAVFSHEKNSITHRVRTLLADSTRIAPDEVNLSLTKPAWRRSVAVSQADTSLWPDPDEITTAEQFKQGLRAIKESTGLSYASLAAASERLSYPLARSTVHALCTKPNLPPGPETVAAFVAICGGDKSQVLSWKAAWQRLSQAAVSPGETRRDEPDPGTAAKLKVEQDAMADDVAVTGAAGLTGYAGGADGRIVDATAEAVTAAFRSTSMSVPLRTVVRLLVYGVLAALLAGYLLGYLAR